MWLKRATLQCTLQLYRTLNHRPQTPPLQSHCSLHPPDFENDLHVLSTSAILYFLSPSSPRSSRGSLAQAGILNCTGFVIAFSTVKRVNKLIVILTTYNKDNNNNIFILTFCQHSPVILSPLSSPLYLSFALLIASSLPV